MFRYTEVINFFLRESCHFYSFAHFFLFFYFEVTQPTLLFISQTRRTVMPGKIFLEMLFATFQNKLLKNLQRAHELLSVSHVRLLSFTFFFSLVQTFLFYHFNFVKSILNKKLMITFFCFFRWVTLSFNIRSLSLIIETCE